MPNVYRSMTWTMDEVFWPDIRREFTEALLKEDGDFLVRKAGKGDSFVVSVFWDGKVRHYQPIYDGVSYSFGHRPFISLDDLLYYHFEKRIPLGGGDSGALLKRPKKKGKTGYKITDIEIKAKLGEGNFGEVYKVRIKSENKLAAMKTLKESVPKAIRETFIKELNLMKTLEHPNCVQCLGVVEDTDGQLRILLECINKGSLDKLLHEKKLTGRGKVRVLLDVARGMQYLHHMNIIHRDLAARNILIHQNDDGTIVGKVSDFGLSRSDEGGQGYELKSAQKLPLKWLAPECFKNKCWSLASDVWSFGILMWEVFTDGADPYSDCPETQGGAKNLSKFITDGGHPNKPEGCRDDIFKLMCTIWEPDKLQRIKMDEVVAELEKIYAKMKIEAGIVSGSNRTPSQKMQ